MTLAELNAAGREGFVEALGWVFEHSPWVAGRAWAHRPFASLAVLHEAMTRAVAEASRDEQLALLRAHPDLGARLGPDGSSASAGEQSGAGLDRLPPEQRDRLARLNTEYRNRFGFPFLFAVTGSTPQRIIESLESRLPRTYDEELLEALRQVARIARIRLEGLLTP